MSAVSAAGLVAAAVIALALGLLIGSGGVEAAGSGDAQRPSPAARDAGGMTSQAGGSPGSGRASDNPSATDETLASFANAEAFAHVCLEAMPERSASLRRAWAADGACAQRWARNAGQRGNDSYTERYVAIRTEMGHLPAEQLQAFCEALNAQPC